MTRGTRTIPNGLKKDWKKLAQVMKGVGWTFEDGSRHVKCFAPDGIAYSTIPKTPSDHRALKNETAAFRRWCRANGITPDI